MDASSRKILGLIAELNVRFVVPVYQRPYSWGIPQCEQLFDDIFACGKRRSTPHFTGSIVTIQDGSLSDQGVAPLLLIDGQQRLTTISLLLIALARYAEANPHLQLAFSRDEILMSGYLTNAFRTGDDRYKLTLSKGDKAEYQALVDGLAESAKPAAGAVPADAPASRLAANLAYFEDRLAHLYEANVVWQGLQRLEIVSIALTQGQDNPQVIFESMNSTGMDLTAEDLIRNFVLMDQPMERHQSTYQIYWQPIEQLIEGVPARFGASFDDFIRCYLTVVCAPRTFEAAGAYREFKRYIRDHSYTIGDRMMIMSLKLKRFAGYYVSVLTGEVEDAEVGAALQRLAHLEAPAARPLLLAMFDAYEHQKCSRDDLLGMLRTAESYLVRRVVCDCEHAIEPAFASSLIERLSAVAAEGGAYAQVFAAMLLNEAGTLSRFPSDEEFARAYEIREMAGFAPLALAEWPAPQVAEEFARIYA